MIYPKLRDLIQPGGVIVEIGAHIGTDTIKLYRDLKPARYYAVEPDIRNVTELLKLNLPITVIRTAVGNQTGKVDFYFSSGNIPYRKRVHTDSNSLMRPKNNPAWVTFEKGEIACYRLDDLLNDRQSIDLIWMDVQGAELLVIEGAPKTLRRTRFLYTECQTGRYHDQPGLEKIMKALPDWEIILKNGENVLLRNKIE